jgi:hypothetical protein
MVVSATHGASPRSIRLSSDRELPLADATWMSVKPAAKRAVRSSVPIRWRIDLECRSARAIRDSGIGAS